MINNLLKFIFLSLVLSFHRVFGELRYEISEIPVFEPFDMIDFELTQHSKVIGKIGYMGSESIFVLKPNQEAILFEEKTFFQLKHNDKDIIVYTLYSEDNSEIEIFKIDEKGDLIDLTQNPSWQGISEKYNLHSVQDLNENNQLLIRYSINGSNEPFWRFLIYNLNNGEVVLIPNLNDDPEFIDSEGVIYTAGGTWKAELGFHSYAFLQTEDHRAHLIKNAVDDIVLAYLVQFNEEEKTYEMSVWDQKNGSRIIPTIGNRGTFWITGCNVRGDVVGAVSTDSKASQDKRAFYFNKKFRTSDIGSFGGEESIAMGVNVWGQVVGTADTYIRTFNDEIKLVEAVAHAFIWDPVLGIQDLNDLIPSGYPLLEAATAINNKGEILAKSKGKIFLLKLL